MMSLKNSRYFLREKFIYCVVVIVLMFLNSCGEWRDLDKNNEAPSSENQLMFLVFGISSDSINGNTKIVLLDKTKVNGSIKNVPVEPVFSKNTLTLEFYHSKKLILTEVHEHPLYKSLEFHDGGVFERKDVRVQEAQFFIRVQYVNGMNKLKISEIIDEQKRDVGLIEL